MLRQGDGEDVVHFGIPPTLWQPWCPFRVLRDPRVTQYLEQFGRYKRYGLPGGRGSGSEPERLIQAFDVLEWAARQPLAPLPGGLDG